MKKQNIKQIFQKSTALLAVSALLTTSALAAEVTYSVNYDYMNNTVTVSGNGDANTKFASLQVLTEGKTFEDVKNNPTDSSLILYRYQADAKNGAFTFNIEYDALKAGSYAAMLVADNGDKAMPFELKLVDGASYSAELGSLEQKADAGNLQDFTNYVKANGADLGFDLTLFSELSSEKALEGYMNHIAENTPDPNKAAENTADFNTFVLIEALNEGKIENIKDYISDTSIAATAEVKDFLALAETEEEQKYITSKMSGRSISSVANLKDVLKEAIILGEVKYATGFEGIKTIFGKYGSVIGVDSLASSSVYKSLSGKDYANGAALAKEYKDLKANGTDNDYAGGGSGGGKVSSSSVGGGMSGVYMPTPVTVKYNDIDAVEWASEAIIALSDKGVLNGKSEGYFKPNDNITREELAKIIVCALGYDKDFVSANAFADVNADDWFCKYVNIAYKRGIVNGIGNSQFGVGSNVTRQDMIVMLYNAFKAAGVSVQAAQPTFADSALIADYAKEAVGTLHAMGIINGVNDTDFDPMGTATRAQAAKVVYGFLQYIK